MAGGFYGPEQAGIHHAEFGDLAREAGDFVVGLLHARGLVRGRITDLGCGSGILAARLAAAGYDVSGVDLSADMVELARASAPSGSFSVGSVVDAPVEPSVAVCAIGEVLGYTTDSRAGLEAVAGLAQRVYDALVPGGVFCFDVATPGRNFGLPVREVFHRRDDWCLGMRATEDGDRLDRIITIFVREPDGCWRRVDEHHVLHLFGEAEVVRLLEDIGFSVEVRRGYGDGLAAQVPPEGWKVFVATR